MKSLIVWGEINRVSVSKGENRQVHMRKFHRQSLHANNPSLSFIVMHKLYQT